MSESMWATLGDTLVCEACFQDPWWREGVCLPSTDDDFVCWDCESRIVGGPGYAVVKFPPEWFDSPM